MKICRFDDHRLGLVEGETVRDVSAALELLPTYRHPLPRIDLLIAHLPQVQQRIAEIQKIGLFLKATSSVVGPSHGVDIAHPERRNDHEIELVLIIGKAGRHIAPENAFEHIAAYCGGLDMTVRGPEERSMRKSIDSYTVLGPWLVTADELPNPQALDLRLRVNGQMRQQANTRDLVLGIPQLMALASSYYTLEPGDVLFTGTPEGVGPVVAGDTIEAEYEGIGPMQVAVRNAA